MWVMAIILGGLMIFFLTPSPKEAEKDFQQNSNMGLSVAIKASFISTTVHRKAIFALLLFTVSLIVIWWSHLQIELYNVAHGVRPLIDPTVQATSYMVGTTIYALVIYLFLIFKRAIKILKMR
ncbi:hypothetical protein P9265_21250 [Schinkia azotoformans]|uniref:hypothetical protein n=1 Tax=Schinkia azotoformans TaxID=1454 RepID=UPI002DBA85B8|nr:hypothetical protein [Schinkia azotoformans]MEC1722110.1 hypothetical protein [Schinkia azotoformans]MED4354809.1 hypothetical protein [Schinkia azotoformans]MED4415185.1 hypothetical protein [Schinkia azotoformans]